MPQTGNVRGTREREDASAWGSWSWDEFEARHHLLNDMLARGGWPASKREIARRLRALAPAVVLSAETLAALPKRRYESLEDVRYTLDALGAFPHPSWWS